LRDLIESDLRDERCHATIRGEGSRRSKAADKRVSAIGGRAQRPLCGVFPLAVLTTENGGGHYSVARFLFVFFAFC
jgi:hypothetical protein